MRHAVFASSSIFQRRLPVAMQGMSRYFVLCRATGMSPVEAAPQTRVRNCCLAGTNLLGLPVCVCFDQHTSC